MIRSLAESDRELLAMLRGTGAMSVRQLCALLGVTATAVKQRLDRSMAAGLVERESRQAARGRPSYVYGLTSAGSRALGDNQGTLASILWRQLLTIDDTGLRQRLITAIATELAGENSTPTPIDVAECDQAETTGAAGIQLRLEAVAAALRARNMPVAVETAADGGLPVLRFSACPYPDLSAIGHDICGMETEMLRQLSGLPMRLADCRCHAPDGKCTYVPELRGSDPLSSRSLETPATPTALH